MAEEKFLTRREFITALTAIGGSAAVAIALSEIEPLAELIQRELALELPEVRREVAHARGNARHHWAMLIDLRKCIGCQACTVSCSVENQAPIGQFRTTVLQYEIDKGDGSAPAMVSLPRLCNHCDNPPCVPVCPVQATFQREDGVVLVDNERCVGCGYCVQACPYDARFINHETQTADKCTFCEHRLEVGLLPACVESCVGGARVIGDLLDADSEINRRIGARRDDVKVLKPGMNTSPRVFYIGLPDEFVDGIDGQASVRLVADH